MLTKEQKKFIEDNKVIILTTASKDDFPRSIFIEASSVTENKLFLTDNYMNHSKQNILNNEKVFILVTDNDYSKVLNIQGVAQYENSGKNLDFIKSLDSNVGFPCKGAVIVDIKQVDELNDC